MLTGWNGTHQGASDGSDLLEQRLFDLIDAHLWIQSVAYALLVLAVLVLFGWLFNRGAKEFLGQENALSRLIAAMAKYLPVVGRQIAASFSKRGQQPPNKLSPKAQVFLFGSFIMTVVLFAGSAVFVQDVNAYACEWRITPGQSHGLVIEIGVKNQPSDGVAVNIEFDREVDFVGLWEGQPLLDTFQIRFSDHLVDLQQAQNDYAYQISVTYPNATERQSVYLAFMAAEPLQVRDASATTVYSFGKDE